MRPTRVLLAVAALAVALGATVVETNATTATTATPAPQPIAGVAVPTVADAVLERFSGRFNVMPPAGPATVDATSAAATAEVSVGLLTGPPAAASLVTYTDRHFGPVVTSSNGERRVEPKYKGRLAWMLTFDNSEVFISYPAGKVVGPPTASATWVVFVDALTGEFLEAVAG